MNRLGKLRTSVRGTLSVTLADWQCIGGVSSQQHVPHLSQSVLPWHNSRAHSSHPAGWHGVQIRSILFTYGQRTSSTSCSHKKSPERCWNSQAHENAAFQEAKLPSILQNIDSKDMRVSWRAMEEFVGLWQGSDETYRAEMWLQLLNASASQALQVNKASQQTSQSAAAVAIPAQAALVKTRAAWRACTPLWVSIARTLLAYGPQESFETVVRMREFALRVVSTKDADGLPPEVMEGAAEDLGELLRDRVDAPWTLVKNIQWDEGPQELLRFLVDSEKVLEDKSWDALHWRTTGRRRVYGLHHRAIPTKPLAFTSVALRDSPAASLPAILATTDASGRKIVEDSVEDSPPCVAVFYSLCATQPGLGGLDVGRQLIYRTCQALHTDVPTVHTFVTLSPIPGFLAWLRRCVALAATTATHAGEHTGHAAHSTEKNLTGGRMSERDDLMHSHAYEAVPLELEPIRQPLLERLFYTEEDRKNGATWPQVLLRELQDPDALMSPTGNGDALQPLLTYLCTVYLLRTRNPMHTRQETNITSDGSTVNRVMDPVAHFHFGNGAMLNTVHWRANDTKRSLNQSLGMMASFQYVPGHLEQASFEYEDHGKTNFNAKIHWVLQRFAKSR